MRWQHYRFQDNEGMTEDLTKYSLIELYEMQTQIEEYLLVLRNQEPAAKRKNEGPHSIWFSQCQSCLDDLKEVRDAICFVKERERSSVHID